MFNSVDSSALSSQTDLYPPPALSQKPSSDPLFSPSPSWVWCHRQQIKTESSPFNNERFPLHNIIFSGPGNWRPVAIIAINKPCLFLHKTVWGGFLIQFVMSHFNYIMTTLMNVWAGKGSRRVCLINAYCKELIARL